MKVKKFERRLSLNKETIVNLDPSEMNVVKGGYTVDAECQSLTCVSCPPPTYKCVTVFNTCKCAPMITF